MSKAKDGDTVKVHYTGKLEDGSVFDFSADGDPLEFTIGEGRIILGFEEAVKGMEAGESKTVNISPEDAYGAYQEELVVMIERKEFPPHLEPEAGQELQISQPNGATAVVTVVEVTDSVVKIDANHPLAGKDLTFDIELVAID